MTATALRIAPPLYLALCLLMGGASNGGMFENLLLQLTGLAMALVTMLSHPRAATAKLDRFFPRLAGFWLIIVIIQFVPLPLPFWTALPGRAGISEELSLLGVTPGPAMLTMSWHDSLASLAWALPSLCLAMALGLKADLEAKPLAAVLVVCAFLAIALGLIQFLGDRDSAAYLYTITNRGLMVGFFANANHMATLLLVTLPFLAAMTRTSMDARPDQKREFLLIWSLLAGFIIIGIALVGSLTGYALALPVIALAAVIMFPQAGKLLKLALIPTVALSVAVIALADEGGNVFAKEGSLSQRGREQIFATTIEATADFWPAGTGLGTFPDIYDNYEDEDTVDSTYVNHAHSDYLEIVLEFGLAGLIGIFAFFAWWFSRLRALWSSMMQQPFVQAAAIASGIILIHSMWDYPLRTAAIGAVFAVCCVILARARATIPARNEARHKIAAS